MTAAAEAWEEEEIAVEAQSRHVAVRGDVRAGTAPGPYWRMVAASRAVEDEWRREEELACIITPRRCVYFRASETRAGQ